MVTPHESDVNIIRVEMLTLSFTLSQLSHTHTHTHTHTYIYIYIYEFSVSIEFVYHVIETFPVYFLFKLQFERSWF